MTKKDQQKIKKGLIKIGGKAANVKQLKKRSEKLKVFYPKNIFQNFMIENSEKKRVKPAFTKFIPTSYSVDYVAKNIRKGLIDFFSVDEGLGVGSVIINRRTRQLYKIHGVVHKVIPYGRISGKKNKKRDSFMVVSPSCKGTNK